MVYEVRAKLPAAVGWLWTHQIPALIHQACGLALHHGEGLSECPNICSLALAPWEPFLTAFFPVGSSQAVYKGL